MALSPCYFMKKKCKGCKEELSIAMFIKQGAYRHAMCDDCRKAYNKKYQKKLSELRKEKLW